MADYFLFSLIDDDQRIAECLISSKNSSSNNGKGETNGKVKEQQQQTEQGAADLEMHYFDETPHLHALYLALLNLPLIQEALLSSDGQEAAAASAQDQSRYEASCDGKERLGPCIATEASTAASVNDSPLQQLQRQQIFQLQQIKQLQQLSLGDPVPYCGEGGPGCPTYYLRPTAGFLATTPTAAPALHTTLSGGRPCTSGGSCSFATGAGYVQPVLPMQFVQGGSHIGAYGCWQPMTPAPQMGHLGAQREDFNLYGSVYPTVTYQQPQQQPQGGHRGLSMQQLPQQQHYMNIPHAASPQVAAGGDAGGMVN